MNDSDPDASRPRDTAAGNDPARPGVTGDSYTPPGEPWFIRQLREPAVNGRAPPTEPLPASTEARGRSRTVAPDNEYLLRATDAVRPVVETPRRTYPTERRIGWWPFAAGAALAAVIALALWLTAPPGADEPVVRTVAAVTPAARRSPATATARATAVDPNAALQCARPETITRLRSLIAGKARTAGGGARGDRLAELVSLSVTGAPDTDVGGGATFRCSGWLSLAAAGVGTTEPVSVTYRVERTADGRSLVSILEGTAPIVAAIVSASKRVDPSSLVLAAEPPLPPRASVAPRDEAPQRFAKTSFNCRRATSQVNRMICASDSLAALDREMADVFNTVRDRADPSVRDALEDSRVDFLNRKQRCSSEACIARVYRERIADLEDYR